jgi:asparagine synthase (glutamine-hydrolysing)
MCGFGGIINWKSKTSFDALSSTASKVSFRGPDNTGIRLYDYNFGKQETEGEVGLFFNRLAIIDLDKRSNQPFENERYVLVFNGEIYNYREIKNKLIQNGFHFETSSDTEVLFNALIEYGSDAISLLNGMFAFAFIDKVEKKIILARDRVGIKPLNYLLNDSCFVFASEIDSIVRLSAEKQTISRSAVSAFLSLQYVPTPFTIWENIYKLPPGCFIEGFIDDLKQNKEVVPIPYMDAYKKATASSGFSESLENLLCNSLELQLQSDVPLGLFLSSGIDSSLLAALINKHFSNDQQFNFFTVAFDEDCKYEDDESYDAKAFLQGFENNNFFHHILHVNPSIIKDVLTTMYEHLDEPFGDYAVMMNSVVSRKAREHVTVVLSGDGSDELFWGYTRYTQWKKRRENFDWTHFLQPINGFVEWIPHTSLKKKIKRRLTTDPLRQYMNLVSSGHFAADGFISDDAYWWFKDFEKLKHRPDLPSLMDVKTYLPDCMFYKVDRSSMGASLEVRVPFLDNQVVDYALQLNISKKSTPRFATKSPLKELLHKLAPHYRFDIPKRGFSFPLREWITNDWKEIVFSETVKRHLQSLDLLEDYNIILKEHYQNRKDFSTEIYRLLSLAIWLETKSKTL